MGQITKEERIIRQLSGGTFQKQTAIASEMFLPNHSGDHSHGLVLSAPTKDTDITNKAYVDGLISGLSTVYLKLNQSTPQTLSASPYFNNLTSGRVIFSGANKEINDDSSFVWDNTNKRLGIGTTAPDRKLAVYDTSGSAQIRLSYDAANYAEIRGGSTGSLYFTSSRGWTYFNSAGKDNRFFAYDYSSTGNPYLFLSAHTLRLNAGMAAGFGTVNLNDKGDSFLTGGNVGIGTTSPKAVLHLKAGTSTASTAPLKFTSGTLLGTSEAGAIEFLSDDFFATITTGAARKGIILDDGSRLTSGKIPVATTNGRLIDLTAQDTETDLKVDYTSGDLDTEAEIITAINTTNAKINSIIAKLKTLGLLAT